MALIKIDPSLEKAEIIADFFIGLLEDNRDVLPRLSIPKILAGKLRPGLSPDLIHASIVSRFNEIGIPIYNEHKIFKNGFTNGYRF